ncbi:MAG: beta-ketoacyl-ACP synthase 3 [Lentisphaeraceae bacterium]|nr:beta-ketoacyl-ACP synthase 3 [Lentisphaeraceae bacterium]
MFSGTGASILSTSVADMSLYRSMLTARIIDKYEDKFTSNGNAFFHVSGAGHEATAALAPFLIPEDYLHLHYRDKALMLARGITTQMFFHSLFCKDASHSRGRQMSAHLSNRELNVMSLVGPVGNNALQAVGAAHTLKGKENNPLAVCSMGEGTSQEGEVLEAIAEAVRAQLPVLFLVQDNSFAISTLTKGQTFYSNPAGEQDSFYSMPITRVNGQSVTESSDAFASITGEIRNGSGPQVIVFQGERLSSHSNADDHKIYRDEQVLEDINNSADPLKIFEAQLAELHGSAVLDKIREEIEAEINAAADLSIRSADPQPIFTASKELPERFFDKKNEYRGEQGVHDLTMLEAIREVLRDKLATNDKVTLFGEDLEDPKGDVFGITKSLSTQFPGRVMNSALTESTIVGVSAGRALAGEHPVAFLQFADFLPIALNQIITEIATMHWRTDGDWQVPMIIMITCGGYRPGLGPFHAQTFEALATHTPGLDVFMPSSAGDAAGMLNTAFESGRPTLFFYPKSCLNETENATSKDVAKQFVPLGAARTLRTGKDITLIGWGNTVSRCVKAADALDEAGFSADVLDLRSLAPWDREAVFASAKKTGRVIVTHEDNLSCGMGAEILASISENVDIPLKVARVTRPDTFVPCNFANQLEVLPSFKRILEKACDLLGATVEWEQPPAPEAGINLIEAIGTSPSDESIKIIEWFIEEGDEIEEGQEIALFEANKATAELLAPFDAEVLELLVDEDETVTVGTPIIKAKTGEDTIPKPVTFERPGTPHIKRLQVKKSVAVEVNKTLSLPAQIVGVAAVQGSKTIHNDELIANFEGKTSEEIIQMTGIETRQQIVEGETILSLSIKAAQQVLDKTGLKIDEIDAIICSTGTPDIVTPSLACRVLYELSEGQRLTAQAHDISAACSGYIYGLQNAYDILAQNENANVLLITAEVLSPLLDEKDFSTAIIFGDAATASIISNKASLSNGLLLDRPQLSALGEDGSSLFVPTSLEGGFVKMQGKKVFVEAVKQMSIMLEKSCNDAGITRAELDLIIPHQANQRIIDAISKRNNLRDGQVYTNIRNTGNTSSNSIPLCLAKIWDDFKEGQNVGLCAFGGGFTFGAVTLKKS